MQDYYPRQFLSLFIQAAVSLAFLAPLPSQAGFSIGYHSGGVHFGYHGHHGHFGHHGHHGHFGHHGHISHYGYSSHYAYPSHYGHYGYGYHSYYYPYGYYGLHSYYDRHNYSDNDYSAASVHSDSNHEINVYSDDRNYGTSSTAWNALSGNRPQTALHIFAAEAQSHPRAGIPKTGYALATAATGDLPRGIWAMRRAFRIDPDSLDYLDLDEKSVRLIDRLIEQYQYRIGESGRHPDEAFMVSALYYLKHDYSEAAKVLDQSLKDGGKSTSLTNLQKSISEHLSENKTSDSKDGSHKY